LGNRVGWHVGEVAGQGRCVQFGIDDVASNVWVATRASVVGLSGMSDELSCALSCRCGVGAAIERVLAATMTSNRWPNRRKPSIFLL
jgi:hypothetical protein